MKPEGAPEFSNCNLCDYSLQEAARLLPAAHVFDLRIGAAQLIGAKILLKSLAADTQDNIFSPYVNLIVDDSYTEWEWSLHVGKHVVWTRGAC